jgi:uncharacterized protein YeeX (DUF496 family)
MENTNNQLQHISENNELSVYTNENGRLIHDPKTIKDITTLKNHYGITVEQINESNALSKENKEVLLATLNNIPICELNIVEYDKNHNDLVGIFGRLIIESGITPETMPKPDQKVFISMSVDEVKNEFSYLTIEDVRIAIKKGIRLEYGKFYGLNIATINFWLKEYINTTKKLAMKSLSLISPKEEKISLSDEQKKIMHQRWLDSWIDLFEKYHEGENTTISDAGNVFYKYCIKNKIGSLTDYEKIILENKAKRLIIANGKEQARSSFQIKEVNKIIEDINKNRYSDDLDRKIVSEAKRLAIYAFFDKLIEQKIKLKDLIYKIENFQ